MKIAIKAEKRALQGTGASRRLRRADKVPGILYGGGQDATAIELDHTGMWAVDHLGTAVEAGVA